MTVAYQQNPRLLPTGVAIQPKLAGEENADAGEISFTDSQERTATASLFIMRTLGDIGDFSKYPGNLGAQNISPNASRQILSVVARNSAGETTFSNLELLSSGEINRTPSLSLTFSGSGATASVNLDLSGLSFELYDIAQPTYRPSAIGFTNIVNLYSARRALPVLQNRLEDLSMMQGELGATESRLNIGAQLWATSRENFASAESRISDIDVGAESADLIRSQILQNAATSLLAQANQQPQLALRLLSNL